MEQQLFQGNTQFSGKRGLGAIVLTSDKVYFFKKGMAAASGAMFGLIGVLVANLIEKKSAKNNPDSFFKQQEFLALDEKVRKKLMTMKEMRVLPLGDIAQVKETMMGMEFVTHSQERYVYQGKIHKKRILPWLRERGINIVMRG